MTETTSGKEAPSSPLGERVAAKRTGEGAGADLSKRATGATARARKLRQKETEPEYRLWSDLRDRRLNGHKFSRQVPLGPYTVDFLCRSEMLVIELDGSQHAESLRDTLRTKLLNQHGYSVLRFWNHEVLRERRAVLETILAALEGRIAPSPDFRFAPATLSPRGEDDAELTRRASWRKTQKERLLFRERHPPFPTGVEATSSDQHGNVDRCRAAAAGAKPKSDEQA